MSIIGNFIYWVKALRFLPHLIIAYHSNNHGVLAYERDRWLLCNHLRTSGLMGFIQLFMAFPEYRSLFYHRTGKHYLRHLAQGQTNLYFHTPSNKIGKGFVIWHGYSTVINAKCIGEDCQVWHNVTIGKKSTYEFNDRPTIGNRVKICTGSIVVGDIRVADDVVIGAGTVVVDSVDDNEAIIVGEKGHIKKHTK